MQVLMHELGGGSSKWRLAGQHVPERRAERVEIRADVYADSDELFGASELWRAGEASENRNRCFRIEILPLPLLVPDL
jgi:hypothetical protein